MKDKVIRESGKAADPRPWRTAVHRRYFEVSVRHKQRSVAVSEDRRSLLETFENPHPKRDYTIEIVAPEFTSVCPLTGQPDFGVLTITYTADARCVELKSLKRYLQSFRQAGIFYEDVTNCILDDLVSVVAPRNMKLVAAFTPRGGISSTITAVHKASN